jgi:hypothetical protein
MGSMISPALMLKLHYLYSRVFDWCCQGMTTELLDSIAIAVIFFGILPVAVTYIKTQMP